MGSRRTRRRIPPDFHVGFDRFPKAVQCTQGRFATTGRGGMTIGRLGAGKAVYAPLPMSHSSALYTGLSSALNGPCRFALAVASRLRVRCPTSAARVRRCSLTPARSSITSSPQPASPDDATSPLELALGNEASEADIRVFAERFHCQVRDSYGSTEGMIIIRRDATLPRGALGRADDSIAVYDPNTGCECPRAHLDDAGVLINADEAIGEIVNTKPPRFAYRSWGGVGRTLRCF